MDHQTCLNCGKPVSFNFCANCGQKAATHRFSLKHLFAHDFIHGVFHLDKGFLFTAKELIVRPGYSIRDYVGGKRVNHFNFVTFILILAALNVFISSSFHFNVIESFGLPDDTVNEYFLLMQKHIKEFYLLLIPVNALFTFLIFRKARQNYAEHLVMNAYKEGGTLMINTILLTLIPIFARDLKSFMLFSMISVLITLLYSSRFYRQYFEADYPNRLALTIRIWLILTLPAIVGSAVLFFALALFGVTP